MKNKENGSKKNESLNIEDTLQMIPELFHICHLHSYKYTLDCMFIQSNLNKFSNFEIIDLFVFDKKLWERIIKISYTLGKHNYNSPIYVSNEHLFEPRYYSDCSDLWNNMPKFLSMEEFKQPGLVFKNVFEHQNKKHLIDTVERIILSTMKGEDYIECSDINVFETYIQLVKLIEALYLIDVRDIIHNEGFLKFKYHG